MSAQTFYDFEVNTIDGKPYDLSILKGKMVLIVNTASECGYTPQYEDLQELHEQYGDKITVLGFPANNFGGQEPGSNLQIEQFCKKNFGVTFQMFEKIDVIGKNAHPLFVWLAEKAGQAPRWNFSKYLLNAKGEVISFFPSSTNPFDDAIIGGL